MLGDLSRNGFSVTNEDDDADAIVINTVLYFSVGMAMIEVSLVILAIFIFEFR